MKKLFLGSAMFIRIMLFGQTGNNVPFCYTNHPNADYQFFHAIASSDLSGITSLQNKDFVINNSLLLDQSMTFDNCNFYFGPGATLTVASNVSLTFNG